MDMLVCQSTGVNCICNDFGGLTFAGGRSHVDGMTNTWNLPTRVGLALLAVALINWANLYIGDPAGIWWRWMY